MSNQTATASSHVGTTNPGYEQVIDEICNLNWAKLNEEDLIRVAWAYYHFSVQFRECLEIARKMYPDDERLSQLDHGARDTDNLSPWPQSWNGPLQQAFKHFLAEHIRFDSDPDQGHGALCRHLTPDDRVLPLWAEFKHMLVEAAPNLRA